MTHTTARKDNVTRAVAFRDGLPVCAGPQQVRAAGPAAMRNPPKHWDAIDEAMDQSFPASDPPSISTPKS